MWVSLVPHLLSLFLSCSKLLLVRRWAVRVRPQPLLRICWGEGPGPLQWRDDLVLLCPSRQGQSPGESTSTTTTTVIQTIFCLQTDIDSSHAIANASKLTLNRNYVFSILPYCMLNNQIFIIISFFPSKFPQLFRWVFGFQPRGVRGVLHGSHTTSSSSQTDQGHLPPALPPHQHGRCSPALHSDLQATTHPLPAQARQEANQAEAHQVPRTPVQTSDGPADNQLLSAIPPGGQRDPGPAQQCQYVALNIKTNGPFLTSITTDRLDVLIQQTS